MKLQEVTQQDEFLNQEKTLDHLFRIQKARCQEFWIYLNVLSNKYNFLLSSSSWLLSLSSWSSSSWSSSSWSSSSWSSRWLHQEKEKYQTKYDRMIAAKKAYEDAGGEYE